MSVATLSVEHADDLPVPQAAATLPAALAIDRLQLRIDLASDRSFQALQDISFRIEPGEIVGVVGESGSGKSLLAKAVMDLLPSAARITGGNIRLGTKELLTLDAGAMRALRGAE